MYRNYKIYASVSFVTNFIEQINQRKTHSWAKLTNWRHVYGLK